MVKVRAGLIGAGAFGRMHLQALRSIGDVEIVAICDTNRANAERAASDYGVKHTFQDYHEMFSRAKLDLVEVCTPESLHRDPVVAAAEHGIDVLVEKPIATTVEDADAMIAVAKKNHVSMMVGHILRWDPRYAAVKEMIDAGKFGRIGAVYARRTTFRRLASTYLMRVGVFPVLGIHDIDLLLWYTKDRVEECHAYAAPLLGLPNPDTVVSSLAFKGGTKAVLVFSFAAPDNEHSDIGNRMEIITDRCFTVIDTAQQSLQVTDENGFHTPDTTFMSTIGGSLLGSLRNEVSYFVDCVKNQTRVEMATPEEATEALKVALACQRSALEGRPQRLS
jgi:UDP-N-acetylglucosamine 3-dehydrogenase